MKRFAGTKDWSGGVGLRILPVVVWVGAVVCVVLLFLHRSQRFEVVGLVRGQQRQIAAMCDGRLNSVFVDLFDEVREGQTLAVLETEQLDCQLATISAQIDQLMAQLVSTQEQLLAETANEENNWVAGRRRFSVDVEQAKLDILRLQAQLAADRVTLAELAAEVEVTRDLLENHAVAPYELHKAQAAHEAMARQISENEKLLEQERVTLDQATRRRNDFLGRHPQHASVQSSLEVIRKEISVQERLMEELLVQKEGLVLRSPFDGQVVRIVGQPDGPLVRRRGEVVLAGDPILTVARNEPSEIVAYASENQLSWVGEGTEVRIIKSNKPQQTADSQVTRLGPAVEVMPQRLWQNPNVPQWGRPVLIAIPPGLQLIPGEQVGIRGL